MKNIFSIGIFLFHIILSISICFADDVITGHYCFTYGDKESLMEAKELTHTLAIRNAIESYRIYIESTGTVKNFILTNDIIQIISSGYLKNIKVIDYKEQGRTICETIQATVSPQAIENIIRQQVQSSVKRTEERGLDNNEYLKIISIQEDKWSSVILGKKHEYDDIFVRVKVLKKTSSSNEHCIVFVTFYDSEGKELRTAKKETHDGIETKFYLLDKRVVEHETLYPGEIKTYTLKRGDRNERVSYKVWLYKEK